MDLFNINMQTHLIVLVLGHLLTGVLIVSYTFQHKKDKSVNLFVLSKVFQLVSWIILSLKNTVPGIILISIGNSLLFLGAACELIAFMMLINQYNHVVKRNYNILIISCILAFNTVAVAGADEGMRIVVASLITASLMVFPVYKLLKNENSSFLQKVIAVFYSITIISLLFRAYFAYTYVQAMTLWSTNISNTWLFLLLYLVMLVGSTGFILLAKEKQDSEIVKAATFDELTDIFNRRTFILQAKELISLYARKEEAIAYLLMDIDDFKKVNDIYGHYMGDMVLKDFATTIKAQLRDYDLFGRYGGEEFAVLLPGADEKIAAEVAERLRKAVESSSVHGDTEIKYTISIGAVSVGANSETTVDKLYRLSDDALYMAKTRGKNRVAMFQNAE